MSVGFAKINRPQLAQAYPRQRLFNILDEVAGRPLTWISANAGAGKTVLMASYLEARALPSLWYRLDARDNDAATFFYYLREAAKQAALPQAESLPLLTGEYAGAEAMFAHEFFAQLFAGVESSCALVFDNYQELPESSSLHGILSDGLEEIPGGIRIFFLSRTTPPAALARWRANQGMTVVDAPTLRLNRDETAGLLNLQSARQESSEFVDAIFEQTNGWAAGVILMYEHINRHGAGTGGGGGQSREAMFHYFATELYENASADMRQFLDWTALVPQFDIAMARKLTGMDNIELLVRELVGRNYFIYEQETRNLTYQYHPLFREFLCVTVRRVAEPNQYAGMLHRAARVLRDAEQTEDAADLYIESGNWPALTDIVVAEAEKLYAQGRTRQIYAWIVAMPEAVRMQQPWLDYWFGICRIGFDLYAAREAFERASVGFAKNEDLVGRCLAAAGTIETYIYEWGDFKPLDRWIDELDGLYSQHADLLTASDAAHVTVALFTAYMYRRPDHPQLPALSLQVHSIIERLPNELLRLTAGTHLLLYYAWWQGDIARGGALVKMLKPLAQSKRISPLLRITWLAIEANYSWMAAETTYSIETAEQALRIAADTGIHVWNFMLLAAAGWGALTSDNLELARHYLERMAATVQPGRLLDICHFRYMLFMEAMHRNDIEAVQEHSAAALQYAQDAGVPWAKGIMLCACAHASSARGDSAAAEQYLEQADQLAYRIGSDTIAHSELLARVELNLPRDNEQATLMRLLSVSRRRGLVNSSWWRSKAMAGIFSRALAKNIETDFIHNVIRHRGLTPDMSPTDVDMEKWPWPLRIYTLGRFSLVRHDQAVASSGKAQKKPLELLKAIIAHGGRDVSEAQLAEALWPDSEGDMAKQSLKSTVHRLRKLLEIDALIWNESKLSLDARLCWVDVWALERILNRNLDPDKVATDDQSMNLSLRAIEKYYPGPFLQGEETAYALGLRERLRSKVLRLLSQLAEAMRGKQHYAQALLVYQKGLEIEPMAEAFYKGILQCQSAMGNVADALATYEHYRDMVQTTLGIPPSSEITTIARALRQATK